MFERLGLVAEFPREGPEDLPAPATVRFARAALIGQPGVSASTGSAQVAGAGAAASTGSAPKPERAVELTITLGNIEPPIWRRLIVPGSLTLGELHTVLQIAMGWQNYHLYLFEVGGVRYGDVEEMEVPTGDADSPTVGAVADQVAEFGYEYDFGDGWEHTIQVEQVLPALGPVTPRLLSGARSCPPEDCGGPWGYRELLEILADPTHEEHVEHARWAGRDFDPEAFDPEQTNARIDVHDRMVRQYFNRRR